MTDYTPFALPDGNVRVIKTDGSAAANIVSVAGISPGAVDHYLTNAGANTFVLSLADAATWNGTSAWAYPGGVLTQVMAPLSTLQARATAQVDVLAEQTRMRWITPGAGQAMEYMQSQAETVAATAAPDPLNASLYPMMVAELNAYVAAGNTTITLRQVVQAAAARVAAWQTAGTTIKQTRLTAKKQIAAATTQAQITAIMAALTWPLP